MTKFIGFSSNNRQIGNTSLEDVDIAKQDLLNHFHTRKGERLGEPSFGSILPDLLFDPMSNMLDDMVNEDVTTIIALDPRWTLKTYELISEEHSITVNLTLIYTGLEQEEFLLLEYTTRENI